MFRLILLLSVAMSVFPALAQDNLGCSNSVVLNGGTIEVYAADGGDTENIQCALDAAVSGGFRDVFLVSSQFEISELSARGFVGDLRGASKASTTVRIADNSMSCDSAPGVAMEFIGGNVGIRNMSISVGSPCESGSTASVVAFYSDPNSCADNRTVFGNVDRVVMSGTGVDGSDQVVGVKMDSHPDCDSTTQKVLGTLKVNRSELDKLDYGVLTSIGGGGQVDVNYSTFSEVGLPISIIDAYQSTTILGNTINFNDVAGYSSASSLGTTGVFLASTADSPSNNATTIKGANKFVDGGVSSSGIAVLGGQSGKSISHAVAISDNIFEGNDANSSGSGIAFLDTSNGFVSGNRFKGASGVWVDLASGDSSQGFLGSMVSGWAIVANIFGPSTAATDISLGSGTEGNIVGRSQGSPVVSGDTANNDVLESASSGSRFSSRAASSSFSRSPNVNLDELFFAQLNTIRGHAQREAVAR